MKHFIRQSKIDIEKYWPIILSLITFISGYATLKSDVSNLKTGNEKRREWMVHQQKTIRELEIKVTRLEAKNG